MKNLARLIEHIMMIFSPRNNDPAQPYKVFTTFPESRTLSYVNKPTFEVQSVFH